VARLWPAYYRRVFSNEKAWPSQKKGGRRVCKYMHAIDARAIYNVLTQSRTVQKGGSNPSTPGKSNPGGAMH